MCSRKRLSSKINVTGVCLWFTEEDHVREILVKEELEVEDVADDTFDVPG